MRRGALISALILAGCSCDGGPHEPDVGRPAPSAPAPAEVQQRTVREWLDAQAVSDTQFGQSVLYAWVSDADAEAVRGGESITTTSAVPRTGSLDAWLADDASDVSMHLRAPAHTGRRLAWPSAWAARLGWPYVGEHAERLARIELRPEALLLVYDVRTQPPTMRFATDRGTAVPMSDAVQVPDLWAAVLLVAWDRHDDGGRSVWREYVLVSPAMIARVSFGSPEIAGELRVGRERLLRLARDQPEGAPPISADRLEDAWTVQPGATASDETLFASAIPNDRYVLDRTALRDLAESLVDRSEPFEWRNSAATERRPIRQSAATTSP